ncbi:hypothetical protein JEM51_00030 [Ligilactobacillus agilis]|uniref:hypothetical protein n=1 Tax=Ligilactobacillus agilis TaxID=1601 RepID=UPI00191F0384|nr:hypothetical protein [Ligilactobacillus agilis]MBL1054831.1 hypothetical protein [Ligilactobacillus agilis]
MREENISLSEIKNGVIVTDVNCTGYVDTYTYSSLCDKYPELWDKYKDIKKLDNSKELFGVVSRNDVDSNLIVATSFSRFDEKYQVSSKRAKKEINALVKNIKSLNAWASNQGINLYIPKHLRENRIKGEWDEILNQIKDLDVIICNQI